MKIAIETLCGREFESVLCARVHTDAGVIGLGETFYSAGAVAAQMHDTLAAWRVELVTEISTIRDGFVPPMDSPGLGTDISPGVFGRSALMVRRSEA